MTSLVLRDTTVKYDSINALDAVSIDIASGEAVAITGPSGSGKTTALKLLSGLMTPVSGTVEVGGRPIHDLGETGRALLRATTFGFVYQDYSLLPYLTALENVEVSHRLRTDGLDPNSAIEAVGLTQRKSHLPRELSGGEQQRVAIARAMCGSPQVIVADEPTGALDTDTGMTIVDQLLELNIEHGVTLVIVTHDLSVARQMSRQIGLRDGKIDCE